MYSVNTCIDSARMLCEVMCMATIIYYAGVIMVASAAYLKRPEEPWTPILIIGIALIVHGFVKVLNKALDADWK